MAARRLEVMRESLLVQALPYAEYLHATSKTEYSFTILLECEVAAGYINHNQHAEIMFALMKDEECLASPTSTLRGHIHHTH